MRFVDSNDVFATIKQRYKRKDFVALLSNGSYINGPTLSDLSKKLIEKGFGWDETPKEDYITIIDVIRNWENVPMCVEYPNGADAMLQDNGYTLDDAIEFALNGCSFFYD